MELVTDLLEAMLSRGYNLAFLHDPADGALVIVAMGGAKDVMLSQVEELRQGGLRVLDATRGDE